jgi:hypothetical protein
MIAAGKVSSEVETIGFEDIDESTKRFERGEATKGLGRCARLTTVATRGPRSDQLCGSSSAHGERAVLDVLTAAVPDGRSARGGHASDQASGRGRPGSAPAPDTGWTDPGHDTPEGSGDSGVTADAE